MGGKIHHAEVATPQPGTDLVGDGFASVREASKFLSMSRAKIYQLMNARELAYAKFGRSRRVPWEGLRDFARRRLVAAS
jgi:excisionase family DNA binding protein